MTKNKFGTEFISSAKDFCRVESTSDSDESSVDKLQSALQSTNYTLRCT